MAVLDEAFKMKIEDPCVKLTRLIKYTTGEVKKMDKNCIQLPPKDGYETAQQMMHQLDGDPHGVITVHRKEIKQWPQIKLGDAKAYRKFHNFLLKCENITHMQTWNILNNTEIMCMQGKEPDPANFIDFVDNQRPNIL